MPRVRAEYPLIDGRILTFDSTANNFFALMFTAKTLGIFDPNGAIPSSNLTTDPTFSEGSTNWNEITEGDNSQVAFGENNTQLFPQQIDPQLVFNGDFEFGGSGWTVATTHPSASVTFANGECTLEGGNTGTHFGSIEQELTTTYPGTAHTLECDLSGDTCKLRVGTTSGANDIYEDLAFDGSLATFVPTGSTFYITLESDGSGATTTLDNIVVAQTVAGKAGISQQVTTPNAGEIHSVQVGSDGEQEYHVLVGTAEGDGSYVDAYTSSASFVANFTPAGTYWITVEALGETSDQVILNSIYSWFVEEFDSISFVTPYLDSELRELYFVPAPTANTAYILHPNHPVYKIQRDPGTGVWNWIEVAFTGAPADWTTGNYPRCGTYFQGRLWLGGTYTSPQTFWGSKSGLPEDFTPGSNADEGLEFTLAKFGELRWMIATKNLLLGTINGEHIVTGDQENLITPSSIQIEQQSSYGSKAVQPLQVGDQVFYVSPDGRKLRAMQYEWTANNWMSRDLTFFSEHITKAEIRSLAWSQHPDQLLWCALEDGTGCCLTYERGENIYGWHRHDTKGYFREFSSGIASGNSFLLALVQREQGSLSLEIQEPDSHFDASDEATAQGGSNAVTTLFTGFEHLAGKVVQVLLDGAVHPDVLVAEDGSVTTEWEGHLCEVGLQFTPRMVTLPFDKGAPGGQSGQVWYKRYDQLTVTFLDSALPVINGERRPDRTPATPMDTREPGSDGLLRTEQVTLGWSQDATVTIEQDLPLACTILSIAGRLAQEKL